MMKKLLIFMLIVGLLSGQDLFGASAPAQAARKLELERLNAELEYTVRGLRQGIQEAEDAFKKIMNILKSSKSVDQKLREIEELARKVQGLPQQSPAAPAPSVSVSRPMPMPASAVVQGAKPTSALPSCYVQPGQHHAGPAEFGGQAMREKIAEFQTFIQQADAALANNDLELAHSNAQLAYVGIMAELKIVPSAELDGLFKQLKELLNNLHDRVSAASKADILQMQENLEDAVQEEILQRRAQGLFGPKARARVSKTSDKEFEEMLEKMSKEPVLIPGQVPKGMPGTSQLTPAEEKRRAASAFDIKNLTPEQANKYYRNLIGRKMTLAERDAVDGNIDSAKQNLTESLQAIESAFADSRLSDTQKKEIKDLWFRRAAKYIDILTDATFPINALARQELVPFAENLKNEADLIKSVASSAAPTRPARAPASKPLPAISTPGRAAPDDALIFERYKKEVSELTARANALMIASQQPENTGKEADLYAQAFQPFMQACTKFLEQQFQALALDKQLELINMVHEPFSLLIGLASPNIQADAQQAFAELETQRTQLQESLR
jgi:hypothetical protein